jgi:nucleoside-diphosphate-sugar epimerase
MNILLTGHSGFIGKKLLNLLSKDKKKHKILCLSRSNKRTIKKKNIFYLKCDLKNIKKFKNNIHKFDPNALIHLAWEDIPNFNYLNSKKNEVNSKKLIQLLLDETKIENLIVSGSCFEIYPPNNSYQYFINAKKNILKFIKFKKKSKDFRYQWLRVFYVYGPGQRKQSLIPYIKSSLKNDLQLKFKTPNKAHDFIYIDDVCRFIVSCLKKDIGSNIFEVGTGKTTSVIRILENIKKIIKYDPNLSDFLKISKNKKSISKQRANILSAKKKLNWKPKFFIKSGIKKIFKN